MKILVIEDEETIREVIKKYLRNAGFQVVEAGSGEVGILKFNSSIHLVVLDLNLPNRDGLEVCQQIRKKSNVPIIMVTARTEEMDELRGLEAGADDYLKKPFSPKVLLARIHALLRRQAVGPESPGALKVDEDSLCVHKNGRRIPLTATQFKILRALVERPGKVFSRSELLVGAGEESRLRQAMERTIDAHIKTIRKMIEDDPQRPKYLKTVIGAGYKYDNEAA